MKENKFGEYCVFTLNKDTDIDEFINNYGDMFPKSLFKNHEGSVVFTGKLWDSILTEKAINGGNN